MIFDPDDPRLTAYALGELEGEDRTAVETLIEQNAEARQFVDETRRLAGLLSVSLRAEPAAGLDPVRRDAIASQLNGVSVVTPSTSSRIPWRPLGLAAAAAVVIGGGALALSISRSPATHADDDRALVLNDSFRHPDEAPSSASTSSPANVKAATPSEPASNPATTSFNGGPAVDLSPEPAPTGSTSAQLYDSEENENRFLSLPEQSKHEQDRRGNLRQIADAEGSVLEGMGSKEPRFSRRNVDSDSLALSSISGPTSGPAQGQAGSGSISGKPTGETNVAILSPSPSQIYAKKHLSDASKATEDYRALGMGNKTEADSVSSPLPFNQDTSQATMPLPQGQPESERESGQQPLVQGVARYFDQSGQAIQGNGQPGAAEAGEMRSEAVSPAPNPVALGLEVAPASTPSALFEGGGQNVPATSKPSAGQPMSATDELGRLATPTVTSGPVAAGQPSNPSQLSSAAGLAAPAGGALGGQAQMDGQAQMGRLQPGDVQANRGFAELTRSRRELHAPQVADPSGSQPGQKAPLTKDKANSLYALAVPPASGAQNPGNLPELKQRLEQQRVETVVAQARPAVEPPNTEKYAPVVENDFEPVTAANTLSTFSIDVDTASYANMRRFLNQSMLPPPDSVRIEEMINYFSYHYPSPDGDVPFSVNTEVTRCPWNPDHNIVRIGLKGQEIRFADRKPTNLVFVVDVSGSMQPPNKLALVKAGLRMLADQLTENDRVSIVVYAGQVGLALPSTTGDQKQTIVQSIDALQSGGSTNGAGGIEMAYDQAVEHFIKDGVNRVILATDGDFNVGTTDAGSLSRIAEEKARTGVFLSVLGVGEGNLNDQLMESIADKGNGNYSYLDNLDEARKVLVEQVGGTLVTIAKDVKIQVDFNPAKVGAYRLVGYENRKLANRDFRDDTKDAGEIGSGHTVTALYEIIPPGEEAEKLTHAPEPSRYVKPAKVDKNAEELLTVRLRYKAPDGQTSKEIQHPVPSEVTDLGRASSDTKFAASVAEFGLLLRGSKYKAQASYDAVLELARANLDDDSSGRRHEFVTLVEKAKTLPSR